MSYPYAGVWSHSVDSFVDDLTYSSIHWIRGERKFYGSYVPLIRPCPIPSHTLRIWFMVASTIIDLAAGTYVNIGDQSSPIIWGLGHSSDQRSYGGDMHQRVSTQVVNTLLILLGDWIIVAVVSMVIGAYS